MNLHPATSADLDILRHWDEQPHVIASDPNDDWHWEVELDRTPDWREQLIAEIGDRAIGFIQMGILSVWRARIADKNCCKS